MLGGARLGHESVEAVVGDAGVEFEAVEEDVSGLEVAVGDCAVEVEVVEAAGNIDGDFESLGPG